MFTLLWVWMWYHYPMELTHEQYKLIEECFPTQRGNVKVSNLDVLNGILYVAEQGCTWRALPKRFGNWHTVYTRMNRWAKSGVLDRVFRRLQELRMIEIKVKVLGSDSASEKVHPDESDTHRQGVLIQSENPAGDGTPRFIWLPQMPKQK